MSDQVEGSAGAVVETPEVEGKPQGEQAPPWGEDFDPARAWQTIQAQRAAEAELRKELTEFRKAKKAAEDAEKSESEKLSEAAAEARREAEEARREVAVIKALAKHGLPEEFAEFLTGDAEAIEAKAAKLAEKFKPAADAGSTEVPGRPKPRLTPGQGAPDVPVDNPDEIAARIRARKF